MKTEFTCRLLPAKRTILGVGVRYSLVAVRKKSKRIHKRNMLLNKHSARSRRGRDKEFTWPINAADLNYLSQHKLSDIDSMGSAASQLFRHVMRNLDKSRRHIILSATL